MLELRCLANIDQRAGGRAGGQILSDKVHTRVNDEWRKKAVQQKGQTKNSVIGFADLRSGRATLCPDPSRFTAAAKLWLTFVSQARTLTALGKPWEKHWFVLIRYNTRNNLNCYHEFSIFFFWEKNYLDICNKWDRLQPLVHAKIMWQSHVCYCSSILKCDCKA